MRHISNNIYERIQAVGESIVEPPSPPRTLEPAPRLPADRLQSSKHPFQNPRHKKPLDVHAAVRVRAAPAAVAAVAAPAAAVAAARVVGLAVVAVGGGGAGAAAGAAAAHAVAVEPGEEGGEEEEDDVHDAEGEARLEQGARLVRVDAEAVAVELAKDAKVDVVGGPGRDVRAVGPGDEAEVVDACDEGAEEACVGGGCMLACLCCFFVRGKRFARGGRGREKKG